VRHEEGVLVLELAVVGNDRDALIECGLDTTAISAKGASGAQAVTVANESTAPAGVTFSAGPLAIGDLGPGQVKGIWLRRTVTAGAGAVNDGAVYAVSGDTLP